MELLMDILAGLKQLARNLWWTWHPGVIELFRDLDPHLWREVRHNPIAFLDALPQDTLEKRTLELALESRINFALYRLREYLEGRDSWRQVADSPLGVRPVAYFSAEFGLHESIPIYSGGLGILAGDHIKSASDLGLPLIGVGLLYAQGYFNQRLDAGGWQQESYFETDIDQLPLERLTDENGTPRLVQVETRSGSISAGLWLTRVGRCRLLLLDSDVPENSAENRSLVARLYGGDESVRIRQELLLGVGGMRALAELGCRPSVVHLNEGHSAFSVLELMRQERERDGVGFHEAFRRVRYRTLFTTHTPVMAGHDRFNSPLVEECLGPLRDHLGLSHDDFMALGRVNPQDHNESFCMTVLGLKAARASNGVSALHGKVSRRMWQDMWPDRPEADIPIEHVTNGIHVASWLSPPMRQLFDSVLASDWQKRMSDPETWEPITGVNDAELWEANQLAKARLINFVQRQACRQEEQREGTQKACALTQKRLHPEILTLGFARRFATYKRGDLILTDEVRLEKLLCSDEQPVQIIIAGKAHPKDDPAKALIQRVFKLCRDERFLGRIVFLEDYDINVARHLLQGVDLWLNTPRRPLEACGTSGMKAVFNGALNCSVLDGWWAEAYNGRNGFAVGDGGEHVDPEVQDQRDAASLYEVLEKEVIPLYYERNSKGVPCGWVARMKNALTTLAWRFNADCMVMHYARKFYLPGIGSIEPPNNEYPDSL